MLILSMNLKPQSRFGLSIFRHGTLSVTLRNPGTATSLSLCAAAQTCAYSTGGAELVLAHDAAKTKSIRSAKTKYWFRFINLFLAGLYFPVPETRNRVVVRQTAGLHKRVHNRRADKIEAAFFQILA